MAIFLSTLYFNQVISEHTSHTAHFQVLSVCIGRWTREEGTSEQTARPSLAAYISTSIPCASREREGGKQQVQWACQWFEELQQAETQLKIWILGKEELNLQSVTWG